MTIRRCHPGRHQWRDSVAGRVLTLTCQRCGYVTSVQLEEGDE